MNAMSALLIGAMIGIGLSIVISRTACHSCSKRLGDIADSLRDRAGEADAVALFLRRTVKSPFPAIKSDGIAIGLRQAAEYLERLKTSA